MTARRFAPLALLLVALACSDRSDRPRRPVQSPARGPLVSFIEDKPTTLDGCTEVERPEGAAGRAPYRECRDSVTGGSQSLVIDADTVVVATRRDWTLDSAQGPRAFELEASRLSRKLSRATRLVGVGQSSGTSPYTYCATWARDGVAASLRLVPASGGGDGVPAGWSLERVMRAGTLPAALSCGHAGD